MLSSWNKVIIIIIYGNRKQTEISQANKSEQNQKNAVMNQNGNQLTLKCTIPTSIVLNVSPDVIGNPYG